MGSALVRECVDVETSVEAMLFQEWGLLSVLTEPLLEVVTDSVH